MAGFFVCYCSIAPCTSEGDTSDGAVCNVCRFISIDWYTGRPSKILVNFLVAFPIVLISIYCFMFIVNDSDEVDCVHEHSLLLQSVKFLLNRMSIDLHFQNQCFNLSFENHKGG